jgi:hypothetical protein
LGIPYALASLSFCISFNLDLLKASATLTLAELWLSLGSSHATRALNLVHGAFPIILGHGGLELRSRAYIVEAKCYLSDTNFNGMWLKIVDVRLFRLCFHKKIKNKRLFRIYYPLLHPKEKDNVNIHSFKLSFYIHISYVVFASIYQKLNLYFCKRY